MNANQRRWFAYPIASLAIGALVWGGFFRRVDAQFGTLVSSGKIHAELAAAIPADADNPDGQALRARLLVEASDWLERADRAEPGSLEVAQLQAWVAALSGQTERAARMYQELRERPDCDQELRELVVQHETKVWSNGGDHARGLAVLEANPAIGEQSVERRALRTRLLWRLGDHEGARAEAVSIGRDRDEQSCLASAGLLEGMGDWAAAEAAYRAADGELRDYRLARLKLLEGETDTAVELLERAIVRGGPEIRSALEVDRKLWVERTGDRYEQLVPTDVPAAPAAGH